MVSQHVSVYIRSVVITLTLLEHSTSCYNFWKWNSKTTCPLFPLLSALENCKNCRGKPPVVANNNFLCRPLLWHCISMTMCVKNRWVSSLCSLEPHHEWWPPGHRVKTSTCETESTFSCQSSVSRVCIPETMLISWRPLVTMLTMVTIPRMLLSTALHCHKSRNKSSSSSPPHTALSYYSSNLLSIPLVNFLLFELWDFKLSFSKHLFFTPH